MEPRLAPHVAGGGLGASGIRVTGRLQQSPGCGEVDGNANAEKAIFLAVLTRAGPEEALQERGGVWIAEFTNACSAGGEHDPQPRRGCGVRSHSEGELPAEGFPSF